MTTNSPEEVHEETETATEGTETPTTEDLEEPSTEKDPGEEPKKAAPADAEPSHEAIGIGVIGGELNDAMPDGSAPD